MKMVLLWQSQPLLCQPSPYFARVTHDHPLFSDDNAEVQEYLEEAYVGTHAHPTLKSFSRQKDGRSSWISVLEQFMSEERWREE